MAVFRQELNWSTYQDKQLDVLKSLEKSFSDSLRHSKMIGDNLTKMKTSIDSMVHNTAVLANTVTSFYQSSDRFSSSMKEATRSVVNFSDAMSRNRIVYDQHGNTILDIDQREQAREERRQREEETRRREEDTRRREEEDELRRQKELQMRHEEALESFVDNLSRWSTNIGKYADEYSTLSNNLIKISGASGSQVNDFRGTLVHDIVSKLNIDTDSFYDPQEVYKQMVSISNQTGIGNVETLKSLTRPIMLASASMDSNISDLATLLGKWSTRYNFSSIAMEGLIDDIRGNTANNQSTAQETLENIAKLESWVGYYAGGNEDKMTQMAESISKGTSWLESMNVDTARYTDYIEKIASGAAASDTQLIQVLHSVGLSAIDAQQMFANGDVDKLYEALFSGEVNIMSGIKGRGTNLIAQTLEAMGMDPAIIDAYSAAIAQNYTSLGDFEMTTSDTTAAESVEEQYVSLQEKTNNWLSNIYEVIADIQETIGFGLSDIAGLYVLYKGTSSIIRNVATLLKVPGVESASGASLLRSGLAAGGANLFGAGGTLGGALGGVVGAGAVAAGAGGAIYGIGHGINLAQNDHPLLATTNIAGGTAMGVGAGVVGASMLGVGAANAWNPVGWALLLGGGATLAVSALAEAATEVSGASSTVEDQFNQLSSSFEQEQFDRIEQLEALKNSIAATNNLEEATQLVAESGLVSLEGESYNTTQELINMISSIQETSSSLMNLNDAALSAAEAIIAEKAAEDDDKVKNSIKDYVKGITGEFGSLGKDDDQYYVIKQVFTQLANSITDETARKEALADVEKVFSDGSMSSDELAFLTDTGGSALALFSAEYDRKDNIFRQSRDLNQANAALSLLGLKGYDLSAMQDAAQLSTIYSNWMKATTDEDKAEYASQYAAIYSGLDGDLKKTYKDQAEKMGVALAVGSNYIPSDQLAYLHEGEAVIPKKYNPMANLNELERLRDQSRQQSAEENNETNSNINEIVDVLSEIKEFLSAWKKTTDTRATIETQKNRFYAERTYVSNYGSSLDSSMFL